MAAVAAARTTVKVAMVLRDMTLRKAAIRAGLDLLVAVVAGAVVLECILTEQPEPVVAVKYIFPPSNVVWAVLAVVVAVYSVMRPALLAAACLNMAPTRPMALYM